MKIATWNVNSVRARINNIKKYLKSSSPDIALLQEIKTEDQNYPFEEIEKLGLEAYRQPEPLDPIEEKEVVLLAWIMLV